jgi:hypothetical protein
MKNLLIVLLIGLTLYMFLPQQPIATNSMPAITPKISNVIDSHAVIKAVKAKAFITGLEGVLTKNYTYVDCLYKDFAALTKRSFNIEMNAKFLIGINAENIKIHIKENTVIVILPEPILIALEPQNVQFTNETGLLRAQLTDTEKLFLLNKATDSAKIDAMTSNNKEKAIAEVKNVITGILKQIPNCERVEYL